MLSAIARLNLAELDILISNSILQLSNQFVSHIYFDAEESDRNTSNLITKP